MAVWVRTEKLEKTALRETSISLARKQNRCEDKLLEFSSCQLDRQKNEAASLHNKSYGQVQTELSRVSRPMPYPPLETHSPRDTSHDVRTRDHAPLPASGPETKRQDKSHTCRFKKVSGSSCGLFPCIQPSKYTSIVVHASNDYLGITSPLETVGFKKSFDLEKQQSRSIRRLRRGGQVDSVASRYLALSKATRRARTRLGSLVPPDLEIAYGNLSYHKSADNRAANIKL